MASRKFNKRERDHLQRRLGGSSAGKSHAFTDHAKSVEEAVEKMSKVRLDAKPEGGGAAAAAAAAPPPPNPVSFELVVADGSAARIMRDHDIVVRAGKLLSRIDDDTFTAKGLSACLMFTISYICTLQHRVGYVLQLDTINPPEKVEQRLKWLFNDLDNPVVCFRRMQLSSAKAVWRLCNNWTRKTWGQLEKVVAGVVGEFDYETNRFEIFKPRVVLARDGEPLNPLAFVNVRRIVHAAVTIFGDQPELVGFLRANGYL
jgi:hypothetical protein